MVHFCVITAHLSAVNRRLWRRCWKGLCARAQSDLVEGFTYRLKIKPTHLTFGADSTSLSQCLCRCRDVLFAGRGRGGEGRRAGVAATAFLFAGRWRPSSTCVARTHCLCTSLTFKAGFSAGPYLTELSIYLFRNGKITVLTQRALSSTAFGFDVDWCAFSGERGKEHVCAREVSFFSQF